MAKKPRANARTHLDAATLAIQAATSGFCVSSAEDRIGRVWSAGGVATARGGYIGCAWGG